MSYQIFGSKMDFVNGQTKPTELILKPVKRRVNPDVIHFTKYKARALLTNIGSYQEAEIKATKAQLTSDLSSNDDDKSTKKHRKAKTTVTDKNYEMISKLPSPPKLDESDSAESTVDDSDTDQNYVPKDIFSELIMIDNENNSINTFDELSKRNMNDNSHQSVKKKKNTNNASTSFGNTNFNTSQNSQHETIIPLSTSTPAEHETDQAFKKFLKRSLITLKYDVESVQRRLDGFETLLEKIDEKLGMQQNAHIIMSDTTFDEGIIFIETETDLNKMEDRLINDSLYRSTLIKMLSRHMSYTLSETIRKIMQSMFSDIFLMKYSFIGFKGKNNFSTLECCRVIFESVRSIKKFADTPNIEIEKPLKNWMAQATQRNKIKIRSTESATADSNNSL